MKPESVPLDQISRDYPSDCDIQSDEERMRFEETPTDRAINHVGFAIILGAILWGLVRAGAWLADSLAKVGG